MKKFILMFLAFLFILVNGWSQKEMKAKARLNHIALYVLDLKKSSDFYSQIVGLDTIPEPFHVTPSAAFRPVFAIATTARS